MRKILLTAAVLAVSPAFASLAGAKMARAVAPYQQPQPCAMTENANVSVNFNSVETDVTTIRQKQDDRMKEIDALLKGSGAEKYIMQSSNYNVNPQNYGTAGPASVYNVSGNLNYIVMPASKAADIMAALTKKGYQASMNVNSYRNGGMECATNGGDTPAVIGQE